MTLRRPYSKILEQLHSVGLRPTSQRMALAKLLFDGTNRHVTAEMLHMEALNSQKQVSLATAESLDAFGPSPAWQIRQRNLLPQ